MFKIASIIELSCRDELFNSDAIRYNIDESIKGVRREVVV
jgi:hypothetical protein